jgi:hypothetical protein
LCVAMEHLAKGRGTMAVRCLPARSMAEFALTGAGPVDAA